MFFTLLKIAKNEDGTTAGEYGLIAVLIAVAAIAAQLVGTNLRSVSRIITTLYHVGLLPAYSTWRIH